jgi:hypothetical protein
MRPAFAKFMDEDFRHFLSAPAAVNLIVLTP